MDIAAVLQRYGELLDGTHTGAGALAAALSAKTQTDRLAHACIALGVNAELSRRGQIQRGDADTIAAAIVEEVAWDDGSSALLLAAYSRFCDGAALCAPET